MNHTTEFPRHTQWLAAVLLSTVITACGGGDRGRDPILGTNADAVIPPTVTATAPVNNATAVPINLRIITADFSERIAPLASAANFTLTCAAPCTSPGSSLSLDSSGRIVTMTFTPGTQLAPLTAYTLTITGATSTATGVAMTAPYVARFTTGATADSTRPRITVTVPATTANGPTNGIAVNTAISATFSEDMQPATLSAASFTITCPAPCTAPAATVGYAVGTRTAVLSTAAPLAAGTTYIVTVTSAATDLAGNALAGNQGPLPAASNYVWSFTTIGPTAPANVTVQSTNPAAGASSVCPHATVNATFSQPNGVRMDPLTVNTGTFTVTGPGPAFAPVTASSVVLDGASGRVAVFTPAALLVAGTTYTAKIKGGANGVKDLAAPANSLANDFVWTFSVATCTTPAGPFASAIPLGAAASFGIMATSATTSTGPTRINGDVALSPGTSQGIPPAQVNGVIHVNDAQAAAAKADLLAAYNTAKALPPGTGPFSLGGGTDLSGLTLAPGTYTSATTILINGPAAVVLDGGGNANATWVFQIGSSLTTVSGGVSLIGGAQAKNVFWVPTADATIGTNTIFQGTILAGRDVTAKTGAVINGRILAGAIGAATVALDGNTVNVPAP
ncbi:MAG TPA: Ig-like domain-containing protein [Usitatibacteraceae bacterium]|nr:Ig-like domain-containing protein [Usitatibacteraceae bacterium]